MDPNGEEENNEQENQEIPENELQREEENNEELNEKNSQNKELQEEEKADDKQLNENILDRENEEKLSENINNKENSLNKELQEEEKANDNNFEKDNEEKLNINKKSEKSSRNKMPSNEEKSFDDHTKENFLDKEKEEKLNLNVIGADSSRNKILPREDVTLENQENKDKMTNRDNEIEQKKEQKEEKNSEDLLETLEKKVKLEIVPYKISPSYPQSLLECLKKTNRLRPKNLLGKEMIDITRTIDELKKDEERQLKIEELEDKNLESKERDDKNHLSNYKQSAINGNTLLQDPFAVFHGAETAYIDQFYKLSDLFVCCPLYYNYRISLEYLIGKNEGKNEYASYHLFNTKETSPPCSHDCCENQTREIDINILNFTLEPEDKTRRIQKFVTLKKACRCAFLCFCACCTRPTFYVDTPIDHLGKIVEMRTCCDPLINVYDINDDIAYVISTSGCDWGYCCRDQCCDSRTCATCEFFIYDSKMKNKLGEIRKDHKSGRKMMPDYDQIKVIFPPEISCQDKILLVCAALVVEYLYFQNFSNSKRCRGTPRFLHSYSD